MVVRPHGKLVQPSRQAWDALQQLYLPDRVNAWIL